MRFGQTLWICPSHAEINESTAAVVRLDPGLAFGTGTHPTTRLCLEYLDARVASRKNASDLIVDFGCGSGVLAIAALLLQPTAHAFVHDFVHDIDPQALIATESNAKANKVDQRIESFFQVIDLTKRLGPCERELKRGGADLVLANILSDPLRELAPQLIALFAPGGEIVLAGLLDEQADEVIAAYTPTISLMRWRTLEGWTCLAGCRA